MSAAIDNDIRSADSVTSLNIEHEITRLLAYYKNSIPKYNCLNIAYKFTMIITYYYIVLVHSTTYT